MINDKYYQWLRFLGILTSSDKTLGKNGNQFFGFV